MPARNVLDVAVSAKSTQDRLRLALFVMAPGRSGLASCNKELLKGKTMPRFKVTRRGTYTQVVKVTACDAAEARRYADVSEPVGSWHEKIGLDYEPVAFKPSQRRNWKVARAK